MRLTDSLQHSLGQSLPATLPTIFDSTANMDSNDLLQVDLFDGSSASFTFALK